MGTLVFQANLGGSVNLIGPNTASTVNFTLPSADGTNGQALVTNGSGTLSFSSFVSSAAGSNTQVQFNSGGAFAGSANLTFDGTTLTAAGLSGPHNGSVGATTPSTGAFTTLSASSTVTFSGGTANGVAYLNGSKVVTSGSALTFDGSNFVVNPTNTQFYVGSSFAKIQNNAGASASFIMADTTDSSTIKNIGSSIVFINSASEGMRLTSTGLGIGTSSPSDKLTVVSTSQYSGATIQGGTTTGASILTLKNSNSAGIWQIGVYGSGLTPPNNLYIYDGVNSAVRATIDTSGNLGLGVTPSAWNTLKAIQVSTTAVLAGFPSTEYASFGSNAFYASGWKYITSAPASQVNCSSGGVQFQIAPSGTTGNAITFTQAMTLTAEGNLGLGQTNPTNISNYKTLTISAPTGSLIDLQSNSVTGLRLQCDTTYPGGAIYALTNNPLVFGTNSTERARIDSSGNFMVGTTSPAGGAAKFNVYGTQTYDSANATIANWYSGGTQIGYIGQGNYAVSGASATGISFASQSSMSFATGGQTERARIDSSGNLLVGTTTNIRTSKFVVGGTLGGGTGAEFDNDSSATWIPLAFHTASTLVGYISATTSITTYNSVSDYRLKNVIGNVTGSGARIDALEPVEYEWKSSGERTRGFLAHKFQEVYPQSVTGTKDAVDADGKPVYQAMQASTSEVIADLVAEIKSLRARVAQLESN